MGLAGALDVDEDGLAALVRRAGRAHQQRNALVAERAEAQTVRMNNRQSARSVSRNTAQAARQSARNPYAAPAHVNRNARQAAPGQPVSVTVRIDGSGAEIRITDRGPGLSEEAAHKGFWFILPNVLSLAGERCV